MADVSIVIPTRDRWPVLEARGLRSALAQEDVDVEVLVVDDGSIDETPGRLAEIRDARVRVLRHEESRGVASARNAGIAAARGNWIAFLDDDDLWSPEKLRTQVETARSSGSSFVYAGVVVVDAQRNVLYADQPAETGLEELLERNTIPAGSSNVIVRTEEVRRVGGFDERLTYVADWDLWIRLAVCGPITLCPELLVGYVRDGSGMRFAGADAVREMKYFVEKHRGQQLRADPARFLRWTASEQRLAGHRLHAASTYLRSGMTFRRPSHLLHAAAALLYPVRMGAQRGRPPAHSLEPIPDVPWLALY